MPAIRTTILAVLSAATLALGAAPARAGGVEDAFRSFIDQLKSGGKADALAADLARVGRLGVLGRADLVLRQDTLPLGRDQYVLFVSNECGAACARAQQELKTANEQCRAKARSFIQRGACAHQYTVDVLNISTSATAREAFALTKARGVPAMLVGRRLMNGFHLDTFNQARALDRQETMPVVPAGSSPAGEPKQVRDGA